MSLLDRYDRELLAEATPAELAEIERLLRAELAETLDEPALTGDVDLEHFPDTPGQLAAVLTEGREVQRPHLDLIDQALLKAATEGRQRLIVNIGPRQGKTRRVRFGILHRLATDPTCRVIYGSATDKLADEQSGWIRDQLESHDLGVRPRRDSRARDRWWIDGPEPAGGVLASGVGGLITGFGADLFVIDDVHKDYAEAQSQLARDKVWDWYTNTAFPRLNDATASVVIVMTRWHEDDLVGRLLKLQPNTWTVIRVPTIAEDDDPVGRAPGELLWPERFGWDAVEEQKLVMGPHGFAAQHQQAPMSRTGGVWKAPWIDDHRVLVGELPRLVMTVVAVDPSGSSKKTAAECGIVVTALGVDGDAYVLDDWSLRGSPDEWGTAAVRAALEWGAGVIVVEDNYGGEQTEFVVRTAMRNLARSDMRMHTTMPPNVVPVNAGGRGKLVRAEPVAALAAAGRIHHVDHGDGGARLKLLEDQLTSWDGTGDSPDRLDALVHSVRALLMPQDVKTQQVVTSTRWAGLQARR